MPLERFFIAYGKQDRERGRIRRRVVVPKLAADEIFRAYKVTKRFDEDISAVLGAFRFTLDGPRASPRRASPSAAWRGCRNARPKPRRRSSASRLDDRRRGAALAALARDFQPLDDHRAIGRLSRDVARTCSSRR